MKIYTLKSKLRKEEVGNKAYNLSLMKRAGYSVPEGIVFPITNYDLFLKAVEKNNIITFKNKLQKKVLKFLNKIKAKEYAIRSSALGEDSKNSSKAGQYDSYLNIEKDEIAKNIIRIYHLFHDSEKNSKIAIVVQKMIYPKFSGVSFTFNPVTNKDEITIEYTEGLANKLVSGTITPKKANPMQEPWCKLYEISKSIERFFKFPQDIEWAYQNNKFYIVQSRPITTISVRNYIQECEKYTGVRKEDYFLIYSIKTNGQKKLKNYVDSFITEERTRAFNLNEAKRFHKISEKLLEKNKNAIDYFLKKDKKIWEKINYEIKNAKNSIRRNKKSKAIEETKKIIELYKYFSANFFILFSLGMELGKKNIFHKKFEKWRNKVVFEEEKVIKYLKEITTEITGDIEKTKDVLDYSMYEEYLEFLDNNKTIDFSKRKNRKITYYNTKYFGEGVIRDSLKNNLRKEVKEKQSTKVNSKNLLGSTVYKTNNVKGIISLINERIKEQTINGRIVVALQITPKMMSKINGVKAIITEEGGITSHAAIIAREKKIPCIVGVENATKILKENSFVEMDFENGAINIL